MEQPDPRTATAATIKTYADAERVARGGSYSFEAGILSAFVEMLVSERDALRRDMRQLDGPPLSRGNPIVLAFLGDIDVWVEYSYDPGQSSSYDEPGYPAEVEILDFWCAGQWSGRADNVTQDVADDWTQRAFDNEAAAADDAAEARANALRLAREAA